jgi:ABC-type uncharacterized transport system substrate-binding protein
VQGFVASMARPGGNLTGFTPYEFSIGGKWLDLLKEAAPALARVAVMYNPDTSPQSKFFMPEIATAARSLGVEATSVEVQKTGDIEPAIVSLARQPNSGLILPTDTFMDLRRSLIVDLALRHRLPTTSKQRRFRKGWRSHVLRPCQGNRSRPDAAGGGLCRSHPQGSETWRLADPARRQIRAGHQSQDR